MTIYELLTGSQMKLLQAALSNLVIASSALVTMALVVTSQIRFRAGPARQGCFRLMVRHTAVAFAFSAAALRAGFVEEFVFRGYLHRQCRALFGNALVSSVLQE